MPKRTDIHKILIIGSGPIVIGQACEFDYSGTQACKALRQEGYEIVLVNSNPATIMTDPETADITYIEPLTVAAVTEIIKRERPDALLPTVGGQTALNLAIALSDEGVLQEYGVEMIGANRDAIKVAENRLLFKQAMDEAGLEMPRGGFAKSWLPASSSPPGAPMSPCPHRRWGCASRPRTTARPGACRGWSGPTATACRPRAAPRSPPTAVCAHWI